MSKIGREVLEETKPADTLISDFKPPELWEIYFYEAVLSAVLVMVAVTNMTPSSCGSHWLLLVCRLPYCKLENLILTIGISLVVFRTGLYCECGGDILSGKGTRFAMCFFLVPIWGSVTFSDYMHTVGNLLYIWQYLNIYFILQDKGKKLAHG